VALLEFALVMPMLLLLVFGILEFGWSAKNSLAVSNAAREGARAASVGRSTKDIEARVRASLANQGGVSEPITIEMMRDDGDDANGYAYCLSLGGDSCSGSTCKNDAPTGAMIRIRVCANNRSLTGMMGFLNRPLQTDVIMRREG
jgi:hypothetical protein